MVTHGGRGELVDSYLEETPLDVSPGNTSVEETPNVLPIPCVPIGDTTVTRAKLEVEQDLQFWIRYRISRADGGPIVHFHHEGTRWLLGWLLRKYPWPVHYPFVTECAVMWAWFGGAATWVIDDGIVVTPKGKRVRVIAGGDRLLYPSKAVNADFLALVSPAGAAAFQIRGTISAAVYEKQAVFEAGAWGCPASELRRLS